MPAKLRLDATPAMLVLLVLTSGLVVALVAPRATGTFSGKNGRIAFVSTPTLADESKFEIYTMKPNGGNASRLTDNAAFDSTATTRSI